MQEGYSTVGTGAMARANNANMVLLQLYPSLLNILSVINGNMIAIILPDKLQKKKMSIGRVIRYTKAYD